MLQAQVVQWSLRCRQLTVSSVAARLCGGVVAAAAARSAGMQFDVQLWLSSNQTAQPVQVSEHLQLACYTRQSITEAAKLLLNSTAGEKLGATEFTRASVK